MKNCSDCGKNFSLMVRIKACFDKNNTLKCDNCGSKFCETWLYTKINFFIPAAVYLILSYRISTILSDWIESGFLRDILFAIFAALWVIIFMVLSQFWSKFKKCK